MLFFLLFSCLLSSVASYEWVRWSSPSEVFRTREYELLTKVLNPSIMDRYNNFYEDFWYEVARHNFSESEYADTCMKAYLAAKPSPFELEIIDSSEFAKFMSNGLGEAKLRDVHDEFLAIFNSSRREAVHKLSIKSLPESREFVNEVSPAFTVDVSSHSDLKQLDTILGWYLRSISKRKSLAENAINTVEQIVENYKLLSAGIKLDLERSFCFRNVFTWINSDMNGKFNKTFESASDFLGLNVANLLKGNAYLSSKSMNDIKKKFRQRAEKINMPAQEYVDLCAKTFAVMRITDEENRDKSNGTLLGEEFGKRLHNSSEEFIDVLLAESAPFVQSLAKRWKYVLSQPVFANTRNYVRHVEEDIINALLAANNRMATGGISRILVFTDVEGRFWFSKYREVEKAFCFESTLESMFSIDFKDFGDFRDYLIDIAI